MTGRRRRLLQIVLLLALLGGIGRCASTKVRPWDRDLFAQKKMQYHPYPMVHALDQHIYFSKEGSAGGEDVAGGGCGCN
jgi:uncharacterized protein DUF4266